MRVLRPLAVLSLILLCGPGLLAQSAEATGIIESLFSRNVRALMEIQPDVQSDAYFPRLSIYFPINEISYSTMSLPNAGDEDIGAFRLTGMWPVLNKDMILSYGLLLSSLPDLGQNAGFARIYGGWYFAGVDKLRYTLSRRDGANLFMNYVLSPKYLTALILLADGIKGEERLGISWLSAGFFYDGVFLYFDQQTSLPEIQGMLAGYVPSSITNLYRGYGSPNESEFLEQYGRGGGVFHPFAFESIKCSYFETRLRYNFLKIFQFMYDSIESDSIPYDMGLRPTSLSFWDSSPGKSPVIEEFQFKLYHGAIIEELMALAKTTVVGSLYSELYKGVQSKLGALQQDYLRLTALGSKYIGLDFYYEKIGEGHALMASYNRNFFFIRPDFAAGYSLNERSFVLDRALLHILLSKGSGGVVSAFTLSAGLDRLDQDIINTASASIKISRPNYVYVEDEPKEMAFFLKASYSSDFNDLRTIIERDMPLENMLKRPQIFEISSYFDAAVLFRAGAKWTALLQNNRIYQTFTIEGMIGHDFPYGRN